MQSALQPHTEKSPVSLEELETILVASKDAASPFTLSLEGAARTAHEVEQFINQTSTITVAVVRKDGLPHAVPVIGACLDGGILCTVSPGSVLANCLQRSPEVAFTVADLIHSVIGAGAGEKVGRISDLGELRARLDRASPFGRFAPEGWDGLIYRLKARRLFAF